MSSTIVVRDQGQAIAFSFEDLMRYHGPGSPGGVAHAYKVLELVLPLLEPDGLPERREITVETAFGGPGARDAFELVTRSVTEDRYVVDPRLERAELGRARARFVFRLGYRDNAVALVVRDGYVTDEFIDLARTPDRSPVQENRLTALKQEMAGLVMSKAPEEVYDVTGAPGSW
jgi:hypothetical protein